MEHYVILGHIPYMSVSYGVGWFIHIVLAEMLIDALIFYDFITSPLDVMLGHIPYL